MTLHLMMMLTLLLGSDDDPAPDGTPRPCCSVFDDKGAPRSFSEFHLTFEW